MDLIHPRCAGIDISKRDAKVCVRVASTGRSKATETVTTWGAVTNHILALRDHVIAEKVTLVVMEATSDYWKLTKSAYSCSAWSSTSASRPSVGAKSPRQ